MISINNENLSNFIMFKLDKVENNFTEEELSKIDEVVINFDEEEEDSEVLNDLVSLTNLKSIVLRNGHISNDDYKIFLNLSKLNEIVFENCEFENEELIASLNLKSLSLINSHVNNLKFIDIMSLEELTIVSGGIDISRINKQESLKYLQVSNSILNENETLNLPLLEELHIDNTNINDFNFVNNLTKLKRLSIDENQYKSNKELITSLTNKGIEVLEENMVEFEGEE